MVTQAPSQCHGTAPTRAASNVGGVRRLSLWLSARPAVGDIALMGLILAAEILRGFASDSLAESPAPAWDIVAGLLLVLPLSLRRTLPLPAGYLALSGLLIQLVSQDVVGRPGIVAVLVMLYTMVVYVGRGAAGVYAATTLVTWFVPPLVIDSIPGRAPVALFALQLIVQTAFCWVLGEYRAARRAYQAEVERRLRGLEFEQNQQARIAVAEERNRIARELHDVLAHSVSVMITQADGAGFAMRRDPEAAERAVHAIADTGRESLGELRNLLQVLRDSDEREDAQCDGRTPQPTASGVTELVDRVRSLGLPITLRVTGDVEQLPTGVTLGIYRIVQESLTNVLKHAGWRATASVELWRDDTRVAVEIMDTGAPGVLDPPPSGGNGVIGMRERATIYGGTLDAGPREQGGWRVRAEIPLADAPASVGIG